MVIERMRTWARKWEGAGGGGRSSTVRELVGWAKGGIKAGGPDRLEQESKEKYLIGIKCPDRVRGRLDSAKCAAFPLAKKTEVYVRGKGGKIIIENPLAFE